MAQANIISLDEEGERWAADTLKRMTVEEKIGQMLMVWARVEFMNVNGPEFAKLRDAQMKYHLGGWGITIPSEGSFLVKSQPYETAALINELQRASDVPLIFAADFERGLSMRIQGTTGFPHAMAFGATGNKDYAFQFGKITAEEARAIGVHWNFYPDADVNSNPANPIINTRAFGEDPAEVSEMVKAYIAGARGAGMLTTAKHFPGHGDTDADTHLALARVNGNLERLDKVELVPFRAAIDAGVDSVMISHVSAPALDPNPEHVATISPEIVTGLLRQRLGFRGITITDAMDMNALMRLYAGFSPAQASGRAAVDAVKAGEDVILIPRDLDGAYNGILEAVRSGEIPESRIDESVLRILRAKASLDLQRNRYVDLNALPTTVLKPENVALAQRVADEAVTLVRNNGKVLPLRAVGTATTTLAYNATKEKPSNHALALVFVDDLRSEYGRVFARELRRRIPDVNLMFLDETNASALSSAAVKAAKKSEKVIVAVYVTPSAGRTVTGASKGSLALGKGPGEVLHSVLKAAGRKTAIISLGSPYLAAAYPETQTYMCTYSNAPVSELSAARAIFSEIEVRGRLPVTIPGIAARGTGLELGR
ncbi:MAG TPA: glycoside hydrolase family 3 N-terminal domain-containing protein [Candidatus Acidoferrales bacterium]|nr:glycoside hydrolase family 3 N-terminal domain-containing protein [Candidatus Acidoferrales bacterium]